MEDTEKYLNDILQRRLGSVPNYGGFSKKGGTVARLPKKEEKIQSMPTVFRKKHESVYRPSQMLQSQQYKSAVISEQPDEGFPKKSERASQNQRIEYMAISKRIQGKDTETISPVVDVSKYRTSQYIPPSSVANSKNSNKGSQMSDSIGKRISTGDSQKSDKNLGKIRSQEHFGQGVQVIKEEFEPQDSNMVSRPSDKLTQNSKKRRIFGRSSEKR